jgi:dCTP deaminase
MFFGGVTLRSKLPELIRYEDGRIPSASIIDCSAITLSLGNEVFITPDDESAVKEKITLDDKKPQFTIPKGQFAFLITREYVTVPIDAMAFISFKAKYKFRGLINVSGFHVDPGWDGRLIFSVFNAGPQDVTLERGDPFALIWYAQLDYGSYGTSKHNTKLDSIGSDLIANMAGEVFSPFKLRSELEELKENVRRTELRTRLWFIGITSSFFMGIMMFTFRNEIGNAIRSLFN